MQHYFFLIIFIKFSWQLCENDYLSNLLANPAILYYHKQPYVHKQ